MASTTVGRSLKTAKAVLLVLKEMSLTENGLNAEEVAELTGKSGATATYLLNSLVAEGFAHRVGTGQYCLADQSSMRRESPLRSPIEELLAAGEELYRQTNERAYVGLPDEDSVVIHDTWGRQGQPLVPGLGHQIGGSTHALASGKATLANLGWASARVHVERYGLTPFTTNTITDPDVFIAELDQVERQGFAVDRAEFITGIAGLAAPVFDAGRELLGVISISFSCAKYAHHRAHFVSVIEQVAQEATRRVAGTQKPSNEVDLIRTAPILAVNSVATSAPIQ